MLTTHDSPAAAPLPRPPFRLLVGLGNPGREYAATRHNVGFMILDLLAQKSGAPFRREAKWNAEIATGAGGVLLCKPQSFMNLSGAPVAAVSRFYKIAPAETLAILDDVALPLGKLRLRASGSAGGHNGLQSLLDHLGGGGDLPRLRVGIGAAPGRAMTSHVLGRFTREEEAALAESLARAVEAIDFAQAHGLAAAMNRFN